MRAPFLAIRESFRQEWQPRGGIEDALIDSMAQAHSAYLFWLHRLHARATTDAKFEDVTFKKQGYWQPPRIGDDAAAEQAAGMADRFHRMFLRSLRALRDLRRYALATVVVQNAEQVNVGQQQVNVSAADRRSTDDNSESPD